MHGENYNMKMANEIEYEYNQFLSDMKNPTFLSGTYMDEDEYEDEYSHNSIDEAIEILEEKIREYLHENRPGEFVLVSRWNVCVMTIENARSRKLSEKRIEDLLVR